MSWEIKYIGENKYRGHYDIVDEDGELISSYIKNEEEAQLIAAAPDLMNKFDLLGHAVVQLLNYMDMENGNIVVREHELDILENLIKEDFGHLVHGEYSNIGDDENIK